MSSVGRQKYFRKKLIYILDNAARGAYSRRRQRGTGPVTISAEELAELRRRDLNWDGAQRERSKRIECEERLFDICEAEAWRLAEFIHGLGYFDADGEVQVAESSNDIPDGAAPANYWDETDALAEQYIYNGDGELDGVRYMVEMSPAMVWLDTETGDVEANDGCYHARYPMGQMAVDWLDEWAEMFGPMSR